MEVAKFVVTTSGTVIETQFERVTYGNGSGLDLRVRGDNSSQDLRLRPEF